MNAWGHKKDSENKYMIKHRWPKAKNKGKVLKKGNSKNFNNITQAQAFFEQ